MVVVACNTATAAAIEYLRGHYPIPFVGMEPAVKPAAINTRTGEIGVLATKGTFKGELYLRTLHKFASNAKVIEQIGEGLVELVESGDTRSPKARELVGKYVIPMIEQGADHIVLGCTHYPFLEETIREFTSDKVTIVNPAPAVARRAAQVLQGRRDTLRERGIGGPSGNSGPVGTFVTTGNNLEILKRTVFEIAPTNFEKFEFEQTEIPYGKL
jgi:glutamate racemase